jgi:hypothetical protein
MATGIAENHLRLDYSASQRKSWASGMIRLESFHFTKKKLGKWHDQA